MSDIHFAALDLNLLRVLDVLLEERSVTRAGERLALSQSAVSHALNRLRHALDDEILVRGPEGMRPTPRASDIAPGVREALLQLQKALAPSRFDPARTDRRFTLICNDYTAAALGPHLVARMRAEAPDAELRIYPIEAGVAEAIDSGSIDIAIGSFGRVPERFTSELLFQESMVWVLSADHPAALGELTVEILAALPHLVVALTAEESQAVDGVVVDHGLERRIMRDDAGALQGALAARGLRRRIGLTLPHALAAPRMLSGSDMAALLPRRLATAYAERYHLALFEPPYPSAPHEVRALWRQIAGEQPAVVWLRGLLRRAADDFVRSPAKCLRHGRSTPA